MINIRSVSGDGVGDGYSVENDIVIVPIGSAINAEAQPQDLSRIGTNFGTPE